MGELYMTITQTKGISLIEAWFSKQYNVYEICIFILQDQKGVAKEEMWSQIWLLDHLPQYGENYQTIHKIKVHLSVEFCQNSSTC